MVAWLRDPDRVEVAPRTDRPGPPVALVPPAMRARRATRREASQPPVRPRVPVRKMLALRRLAPRQVEAEDLPPAREPCLLGKAPQAELTQARVQQPVVVLLAVQPPAEVRLRLVVAQPLAELPLGQRPARWVLPPVRR